MSKSTAVAIAFGQMTAQQHPELASLLFMALRLVNLPRGLDYRRFILM
jgi:hypothetical protein